MWFFICIATGFTSAYLLLTGSMIVTWLRTPAYKAPAQKHPQTCSVLVPARNEETGLQACLQSLCAQRYPAECFEIVVIDDFSEDRTPFIAESFASRGVQLLKMKNKKLKPAKSAGKKQALAHGIEQTSFKYILTTDADCISPPERLRNILSQMEDCQLQALTAPVLIHRPKGLWEHFQALDFLSLMGVTALAQATGLSSLSNGANFCFSRRAFEQVRGYEGIDEIASGDDVMLMQKIKKKFPRKTAFAKNRNAAVFTRAEPGLRSFLRQRRRWAAKTNSHGDFFSKILSWLVWGNNASLGSLAMLIPALPDSYPALPVFFLCLSANAIADYSFLHIAANFFGQSKSLRYFVPAFFMHRLYVLLIGFIAILPLKTTWKGRKISK